MGEEESRMSDILLGVVVGLLLTILTATVVIGAEVIRVVRQIYDEISNWEEE